MGRLRVHVDADEPLPKGLVKMGLQYRARRAGGTCERPQNLRAENLMPACPPCNIDKHASSLEGWRGKLQSACDVLRRNQPTYRHALRFGLVAETGTTITFYFERYHREAA